MLPTLNWAAAGDVVKMPLVGGAEDFSFFAKEVIICSSDGTYRLKVLRFIFCPEE